MPHYKRCPNDVAELGARVLERYHGNKRDAGLSIDWLFAFSTKDEPAISHGGYPALAIVKINPLKARALGHADIQITIDGDRWSNYEPDEQAALIDPELTHIELQVKAGVPKRDDLDRPKLKMRKHDHQHGWFDEIVRRHGYRSIEWQQFKDFRDRAFTQLWLPGLGPEPIDDQVASDVAAAARDPNVHATVQFASSDGTKSRPMTLEEFRKLPEQLRNMTEEEF